MTPEKQMFILFWFLAGSSSSSLTSGMTTLFENDL
jgi:hypothetical protein